MSLTIVTLWWLFFWTAIGLCVGSFLNAVIHRLPRNRSLRSPVWSFCPYCHKRIHWYDNVPLLSFVLLRGRCRACRAPIATRYLVIEASMAIIVLVLLDAFFIGQARSGLSGSQVGLTDCLVYDWPILTAHIILFAALLSMSAIDLEHYWVDIRFTNLATAAGFLLHMLWMPKRGTEWMVPSATMAVVALCAVVGLGVTWLVLICQPHVDPEDFGETVSVGDPLERLEMPEQQPRAPLRSPSRLAGYATAALLAALLVGLFLENTEQVSLKHAPRALLPLALLFILIVSESTVVRSSDQAIVDAIEEEKHLARRMVLSELALLLPAVLFAIIGFWAMRVSAELPARVHETLQGGQTGLGHAMLGGFSPLRGLATAATGYVVAGALGWTVRIVFTLIFGKEAFGTGDIHLMAAAGCVAGWPIVVIGFFLTCGLALLGWTLALPFKRTRALPLGPWLSLSFLTVVVFYDRILTLPIIARTINLVELLFPGNSQLLGPGGVS